MKHIIQNDILQLSTMLVSQTNLDSIRYYTQRSWEEIFIYLSSMAIEVINKITVIDCSANSITDEDVPELIKLIDIFPSVATVDISSTYISSQSAALISTILEQDKIKQVIIINSTLSRPNNMNSLMSVSVSSWEKLLWIPHYRLETEDMWRHLVPLEKLQFIRDIHRVYHTLHPPVIEPDFTIVQI